jgi:hypothetical protein
LDISATSSSSLPVGPADTPSSNDVQPPSTTSYFLGFESPSSAVSSVVQTTSSLSSGPSSGAYISYPRVALHSGTRHHLLELWRALSFTLHLQAHCYLAKILPWSLHQHLYEQLPAL